ncbi:MAG: AAA family ATPase [Chloroflexi bacterium]|nr:AAA family ATPase [Chloroflexota bacterium]
MKAMRDILGDGPRTRTTPWSGEGSTADEAADDTCPLCAGARFIRVTDDPEDPRFGRPEPCECARFEPATERRQRLLRYSRLGPMQRLSFETLLREGRSNDELVRGQYAEAVEIARRYADRPEGWLLLTGPHGAGKTHVAAAIANRVIERGDPALFLTVADLLDHLRSGYGDDAEESYDALLEQVRTAPLLVLDDLDAYAETPWAREKFFQVVSYRFGASLPTVFTMARPVTELDARLASRLVDPAMAQVVELAGAENTPRYTHIGAMTRERLASFTFAKFIPDGIGLKGEPRKSLEGAFRRTVQWSREPDGWIVLIGGNGCGKTHLAAAIANERLTAGDRVAFANVADLLDELRAAFAPDAPRRYEQVFRALVEAPVLVLDDLGAQKSSPWAEEKLYQLLNHRHLARLHTVVTTNKKLSELETRIASRLADREVSEVYEITAPDFRTLKG